MAVGARDVGFNLAKAENASNVTVRWMLDRGADSAQLSPSGAVPYVVQCSVGTMSRAG
jgi:hypothetical protein